jgi:ATP synthase protein I
LEKVNDPKKGEARLPHGDLVDQIRIKERRRLRSRDKSGRHIWFGFGVFGMVGWAVAIPTLLGIFLGVWIDLHRPGRTSWTLMLLVAGLVCGCANAWFWLRKERDAIFREREKTDD